MLSGSEALVGLCLLDRYNLSIYERDIILHDRFLPSFLLFIYKSRVLLESQQFLALENVNCILNFCLPDDKKLGDSSQQIYSKVLFE